MTRRKDPRDLKINRIKIEGHGFLENGAAYGEPSCMEDDCIVFYRMRISAPGTTRGYGHGACECGARSPHFSTQRARRKWYEEHRQALLLELFSKINRSEDAA